MLEKEAIRRSVWTLMEKMGISRFPKPIDGRIPNFRGSEEAAKRLVTQAEFHDARVVKVNPDYPQTLVRRKILSTDKLLIMPSPRLSRGFILLNPKTIPKRYLTKASTIRGAFKYGSDNALKDIPKVDLIVVGSVAVTVDGIRIGKGGGYGDIEYGILRELGLVDEKTPVFTTVHDIQIIDKAPKEEHDFVVDAIFTPSKSIRIPRKHSQPQGVIWKKLTTRQLGDMPVLRELQ